GFQELLRRHESLRTHFVNVDGIPGQVIDTLTLFSLPVEDLSSLSAEEKAREWKRLSREEARRSFDLRKGPLLRAVLLKLGTIEHILLVTIHHIAADGWSLGVLYRELGTLYAAHCQGKSASLPELPVQYVDYAAWQRDWLSGSALQEHLAYWRDRLTGAPLELSLPVDRPRPQASTFAGEVLLFQLPAPLVRALEELARTEQATLFMVLLAAYQMLLSRYSGQADIVVG